MAQRFVVTSAAVVIVSSSFACASALAQRPGQSISLQHGIVVATEQVDLNSQGGGGALVGGLAGYATASGRSSSRRLRNALIGSAVGGAVSSSRGGSQGVQYTVSTASGEIVVVSDQTEIDVGDCVTVENAGSGAANIRRASAALCEDPAAVDDAVASEMQNDAADCLAAKDAMLAAETDEEVEQAVRKAKIVCNS